MRAARLWATGSGIEVAASARASSRCRTQSARCSSSRTRNESHVGAAVAAGVLSVRGAGGVGLCCGDGGAEVPRREKERRPTHGGADRGGGGGRRREFSAAPGAT